MECPKCKTQNSDDAQTCSICGYKFAKKTEQEIFKNNPIEGSTQKITKDKKNYSKVFWKWFGIWAILNMIAIIIDEMEFNEEVITSADYFALGYLIAFVAATIFFCRTTHNALKEIGKTWGWVLGLLMFVPFGYWIVFFVVRTLLMPQGYWISKHQSFKLTKNE
jgi:uncharacterized membrane protein YhaH (DUF805 family)